MPGSIHSLFMAASRLDVNGSVSACLAVTPNRSIVSSWEGGREGGKEGGRREGGREGGKEGGRREGGGRGMSQHSGRITPGLQVQLSVQVLTVLQGSIPGVQGSPVLGHRIPA